MKRMFLSLLAFMVMLGLAFSVTDCTDSDGTNLYVKGTTTGWNSAKTSKMTSYDGCTQTYGGAETTTGAYVVENVCDSEQKVHAYYYACPSGYTCSGGACIQQSVNSCTDEDGVNYYLASKIKYTDSSVTDKPLADVCSSEQVLMERTCTGTNPDYKSFTCPSGYKCSNGACVQSDTWECADSDGGDEKYTKGTVSYYKNGALYTSYVDSCKDTNTVKENFCVGTTPNVNFERTCPSGYQCSNGACVQSLTHPTCSDSDGGSNLYSKGTATGVDSNGASYSKTEYCSGSNGVLEYSCVAAASGDILKSEFIYCPSGYECENAVCVQSAQDTCSETDNGKNFYTKSTTVGKLYTTGVSGSYTDACTVVQGGAETTTSQYIKEFSCGSDGKVYLYYDSCPSGYTCKNGACTQQSVNSCTDEDGVNYYLASKIKYTDSSVTDKPLADVCSSEQVLMERTCTGTNPDYKSFTCPSGYKCSNGACVQSTTTETKICTETDNGKNKYIAGTNTIYLNGAYYTSASDYCKDDNTVAEITCNGGQWDVTYETCDQDYKCQNGACVQQVAYSSCSASDGYNIYTYGTRTVNNSITAIEYCTDDGKLVETWCSDNYGYTAEVYCPSGYTCSEGACVQSTATSSCTSTDDSAGSYSIYTKGTRYVDNIAAVEYCDQNGKLIETWCNGDGVGITTTVVCPSGYSCSDGACVQTETPQPTENKTWTVSITKGWQMISTPIGDSGGYGYVTATDCVASDLKIYYYTPSINGYTTYPLAIGDAYFGGTWGYWVKKKTDGSCKITLTGSKELSLDGKNLAKGWNQIGGPYNSVTFSEVAGSCVLKSGPWYYDTSSSTWVKATKLEAGKGYFVKVENACELGEGLPPMPE